MKFGIIFILLFIAGQCRAQFSINTPVNANQLAQTLLGKGVTISNVTLTGQLSQTGIFKSINTIIPYDSGIA